MTLLELLLAMGMAIMLIVIAFSVYSTVMSTIRAQSLRRATRSPAVEALDLMNHNLTCSLIPLGLTNAPFILDTKTNGKTAVRLRFFTTENSTYSNDWKHYDIIQIQYMLRSCNVTNGYSLIRQRWSFRMTLQDKLIRLPTADSHSPEEKLVTNINKFQIEVFNGQEWTNQWGIEQSEGIPQAARISIDIGQTMNSHTLKSETIIPAGHCIGKTKK